MFANTNHPDCPVRIMYTDHADYDAIHANELDERPYPRSWGPRLCRPLAIIRCTEFSDYSGSDVERSNYRVILNDGSDSKLRPGMIQIIGQNGYQALAYDATLGPVPGDEELYEMLCGVSEYPLIDEDDHSELESDLESEAWVSHGLDDFKRAIVEVLDLFDDDGGAEAGHEHELPDDDERHTLLGIDIIDSVAVKWGGLWWDLWSHGCDEFNVNGGSGFQVETGGGVHFYIDEWMKRAKAIWPTDTKLHILQAFKAIAKACRIAE